MSMMSRVTMLSLLLACLPLVTGGGGINPPPFPAVFVGPTVNAIIVMDPHDLKDPDNPLGGFVTTTGKQASIWISYGNRTAGAVFDVPLTFALFLGCDLTRTQARFVNNGGTPVTLDSWIPETVVARVFSEAGLPVTTTRVPAVRRVTDHECSIDPNPANNGPDVASPGFLVMQMEIGFLVPRR